MIGKYAGIIFSILIFCAMSLRVESAKRRPPKIEIESWMSIDATSRSWEVHNLTILLERGEVSVIRNGIQLTFVISQHIDRLRMSCTAPYPVTWVPEADEEIHLEELHYHGIYDTRIASNWRDPKTFIYKSTIELYSSATPTRNYTCQSLSNANMQRSAYIYWAGNSYLVYGGETLDAMSQDNRTVVLPCRVSKPEITVGLYKDAPNGYIELFQNSSITFDPQIGFTLNLIELANPYGRYKCVSGDDLASDEVDSVKVTVLQGLKPHEDKEVAFNQTIIGNATFKYDSKLRKMSCCSSSGRPPNMRFSFCHNQMTCKRKERFLHKLSSVNRNLWMSNGSCSIYDIYPRESGILRCRGDGIDVFRSYYAGVIESNGTFPLYFSKSDIDPDQMVNVIPSYQDVVYERQNFTVHCDTADFYFSQGLHWAVKYKNNSLRFIDEKDASQMSIFGYGVSSIYRPTDFHTVVITADKDMYSATCFAPVWNSSHWVRKELILNVKEAQIPSINLIESVHWKLNETGHNITCTVDAKPSPFVRWRKNNKTVIGDVNIRVDNENNSYIIVFHTISHSTAGEYKCMASNMAGTTIKIVNVYVDVPPESSAVSTVLLVVTVIFLAFLAAVGALVWRLKLQKNIIDHLTGVVFRDVGK